MNDPRPKSRLPALLLLLALGLLGLGAAVYFRPAPVEGDPALLLPDSSVTVESTTTELAFIPAEAKGASLVFYTGARVPAEAYAYLGRGLAARGHLVVIARFPLGFALFAPDRAEGIMARRGAGGTWALGGHSLGGAMAAAWLHGHPEAAKGLLLLASWPPSDADFSASTLSVLSLSASMDGLATPTKIEAARHLLPPSARSLVIEGGNHAGFGNYGSQDGDGKAAIDPARQRAAVLDETLAFLESLAG